MSEKLTPEWLMDEAERLTRHDCDHKLASACRLAARALRAREWAEAQAVSLASLTHPDNFTAGQECAVMDILAILDGREP